MVLLTIPSVFGGALWSTEQLRGMWQADKTEEASSSLPSDINVNT